MAAPRDTITPVEPRFVLNLDDLPKVIEADGIVWPVYLTARDCARLFAVDTKVLTRWMRDEGFPVLKVGRAKFVEVAALNDWLVAHSIPLDEVDVEASEYDVFADEAADD